MYRLTGKESLSPCPDSRYTESPSKKIKNKNQLGTVKSGDSRTALLLHTLDLSVGKKKKNKIRQTLCKNAEPLTLRRNQSSSFLYIKRKQK